MNKIIMKTIIGALVLVVFAVAIFLVLRDPVTEEPVRPPKEEDVSTVEPEEEPTLPPEVAVEEDEPAPGEPMVDPEPVPPTEIPDVDVDDPVEALREEILSGPYGEMDIDELIAEVIKEAGNYRIARLALLVRKDEVLPAIRETLRNPLDSPITEELKDLATDDEGMKELRDGVLKELLFLIQRDLRWSEFQPEVLQILDNTEHYERLRGRAALVAGQFQDRNALSSIRDFVINAEDPQSLSLAVVSLGMLGEERDVEIVEPLLHHDSPFVQVRSARVLGQLGSSAGENKALELSYDDNFGIRNLATEALSYIGTPDAMARLKEMKLDDQNVRRSATEHLGRAELDRLSREEAVMRLEEMLLEESPTRWAFMYLADHLAYEGEHILEELAQSPGEFGHAARVALLKMDSGVVTLPDIGRRGR